ncbi:hypothetical protein PRZ48_005357 [Zasmidium cellare]|uniref:Major facilitator superfamily (MFS) profile domain-containing protein n=1 Tax=Zasmidium cellare TaxID=395010 RepID=A0ABR0ETL3_ZASCE|nr:hypothetical protein PRZ48_005357 [Zasmidium cellare]
MDREWPPIKHEDDHWGHVEVDTSQANSEGQVNQAIDNAPQPTAPPPSPVSDDGDIPKGLTFALIMVSFWSCIFMVSLDRTIVATTIPTITDEFHSSDDVLWYSGAYLMASCATQLLWGRVCTFYKLRYLTVVAAALFIIGSAICGSAPNSLALIIGRAVAGMGQAAIFTCSTVIIVLIVPLRKRPLYASISTMLLGIASILGPLIGLAIAALIVLLRIDPPIREKLSVWSQIRRMDPPGQLCLLTSVICLLLALQWGGVKYGWSSGRIIALFVLSGVLILAFWIIQALQKTNATINLSIIGQRSVAASTVFATFIGGTNIVMTYWLAIWFQVVKGTTALGSGIHTLPLVISYTLLSMSCGVVVTRSGYYQPPMYLSSVLVPVGTGLMTTFVSATPSAKWIGYQIIVGCGLGIGTPLATVAVQNSLAKADTPVGITLVLFAQSMGGAVLNAIAQALYDERLQSGLEAIPGIDPIELVTSGATNFRQTVPPGILHKVLSVYSVALKGPFYVAVVACAMMIIPALVVEWKKLPPKPEAMRNPPTNNRQRSPAESEEHILPVSSAAPSLALPDYEPFAIELESETRTLEHSGPI